MPISLKHRVLNFSNLIFILFAVLICEVSFSQVMLKDVDNTFILIYPDSTWTRVPVVDKSKSNYDSMPSYVSHQIVMQHVRAAEEALTYQRQLSYEIVKLMPKRIALEEAIEMVQPGSVFSSDSGHNLIEQYKNILRTLSLLSLQNQLAEEYAAFLGKILLKPESEWMMAIRAWAYENSSKLSQGEIQTINPNEEVSKSLSNPCSGALESLDYGGEVAIATKPGLLAAYTDASMKSQYVERDMLSFFGSITKRKGGVFHFNLEIILVIEDPEMRFGNLPLGAILELHLLDGETLRLFNNLENSPLWDENIQAYRMMGLYPLGVKEIRMLTHAELSGFTVGWSKVIVDFDVFKLNFFSDKLHCLLMK